MSATDSGAPPHTKDGEGVRAGDSLHLAFARHESPLNVHFSLTHGHVVEAQGSLVVVSKEYGNWGVTPYLGNWFSTVEAAKLHALAEAEEAFAKFRTCVKGARACD